jgi:hypothetical protein
MTSPTWRQIYMCAAYWGVRLEVNDITISLLQAAHRRRLLSEAKVVRDERIE